MAGLAEFCKEKGIEAAHITGLGAASELTLAYYDLEEKEYKKKTFTENVEVASLTGNVGVKEDGELVVHIHGVFGREDLSAFGGHIVAMIISGAGEIHLRSLPGTINRKHDPETGLPLMCAGE